MLTDVWCEEAICERRCQWTTDFHICFLDLHTSTSSYWKSTQNVLQNVVWVTAWTLLVFLLFHVILEILQEDCESPFATDVDVALPVPLATNISSRCQDLLWWEASMIVSIQSQILTDVSTNDTAQDLVELWDLELPVGRNKLVKATTDCKSCCRQLYPEHLLTPHISSHAYTICQMTFWGD